MNSNARIHTHWQVAESRPKSQNLPKSLASQTLTKKKHGHTTLYMTVMPSKSWSRRIYETADFTQPKNGVYFEAGYALDRGLPVIYLCREDDFGETHFDTNHFPHIVYSDLMELQTKLMDRIQAWLD